MRWPLLTVAMVWAGLAAGDVRAQAPAPDERARAELEQQLAQLVRPLEPKLEVSLVGLGLEGYRLEEADFELDDVPLATPGPETLHAQGMHRLLLTQTTAGTHTLAIRLVFRDVSANLFSDQAGYTWRLNSLLRFELQRGLQLKLTVRPVYTAEEKDVRKRFSLAYEQLPEMQVPAEDRLPVAELPPEKDFSTARAVPVSGVLPARKEGAAPAAQEATAGTLQVRVRAGRRTPVAAEVRLSGPQSVVLAVEKGTGPTEARLAAGRYEAQVRAEGYLAQLRQVEVRPGEPLPLDFSLEKAPRRMAVHRKEETLEVKPPLRFAERRAVLPSSARSALAQLVDVLVREQVRRVRIEGHCDGKEKNAQALSEARARAVAEALERAGVDPARLEVVGHGAERPVAPNLTRTGRGFNRRVELVVVE